MLQPRHSGQLELGRRAEHHLQAVEIAAANTVDIDPGVQRLVQRRPGLDRAELERSRKPRYDHQQANKARDESVHHGRSSHHRPVNCAADAQQLPNQHASSATAQSAVARA